MGFADLETQEKDALLAGCAALDIHLQGDQADQLADFIQLLRKWNRTMNLVSRQDIHRLIERHIVDSLTGLKYLQGSRILDVGSGAGLPGIPLAILDAERNYVLCERMDKRARYLEQMQRSLKLNHVSVLAADVKDLSEPFDTVIVRAVATVAEVWAKVSRLLIHEHGPSGQLLFYARVERLFQSAEIEAQEIEAQEIETKDAGDGMSDLGLPQDCSVETIEIELGEHRHVLYAVQHTAAAASDPAGSSKRDGA